MTLDCQSQSNPLNWIAIWIEQSINPIQQYPDCSTPLKLLMGNVLNVFLHSCLSTICLLSSQKCIYYLFKKRAGIQNKTAGGDFLSFLSMLLEWWVNYSTLFTLLVGWHTSAVSFPPGDIILAQLACPLNDIIFVYIGNYLTYLSTNFVFCKIFFSIWRKTLK